MWNAFLWNIRFFFGSAILSSFFTSFIFFFFGWMSVNIDGFFFNQQIERDWKVYVRKREQEGGKREKKNMSWIFTCCRVQHRKKWKSNPFSFWGRHYNNWQEKKRIERERKRDDCIWYGVYMVVCTTSMCVCAYDCIWHRHTETRMKLSDFNWEFLFVVISIVVSFIAFHSYTDIHWLMAWVFFTIFSLSIFLSSSSKFVQSICAWDSLVSGICMQFCAFDFMTFKWHVNAVAICQTKLKAHIQIRSAKRTHRKRQHTKKRKYGIACKTEKH